MCLTAYTYLRRGRSAISSVYVPILLFFGIYHTNKSANEDAYSRCRVCFGLLTDKHNEEQIHVAPPHVACMSVVANISNSYCISVFRFVSICLSAYCVNAITAVGREVPVLINVSVKANAGTLCSVLRFSRLLRNTRL